MTALLNLRSITPMTVLLGTSSSSFYIIIIIKTLTIGGLKTTIKKTIAYYDIIL